MNTDKPIVIIGAGIGGLATALALLRRGFKVEIYEQADKIGEVGAGLQISANGAKVLADLGLREQIAAVACETQWKVVRHWSTAQEWRWVDLGAESEQRYGAPYWTIHRADLHNILLDAVRAAAPNAIRTGKRCRSLKRDGETATVEFEDGEVVSCRALIGADGVHSAIRQALLGASKAKFTGLMAWRGTIPIERLPSELQAPIGTNWIGPGAHIITYRLRRGELFNFVGIVERSDWQIESWSTKGTIEEVAADFKGWHPLVQKIISAIDTPFKWALCGREPLKHYAYDNVCLLGDSAHPTLPFMAQGAVMALEDALVLARCFEKYATPELAFAKYDDLRVERTSALVRAATDNTGRFHNPDLADPARAAEYVEREWQPARVHERYDWVYSYNPVTVPV